MQSSRFDWYAVFSIFCFRYSHWSHDIKVFYRFNPWKNIEVNEMAQNVSYTMRSSTYSFWISAFILGSIRSYVRLKGLYVMGKTYYA
jgi:hypothetical protein